MKRWDGEKSIQIERAENDIVMYWSGGHQVGWNGRYNRLDDFWNKLVDRNTDTVRYKLAVSSEASDHGRVIAFYVFKIKRLLSLF